VEHDTSTELDARECTEVIDAELVSGIDLGNDNGSDRCMERSRDGRHKYKPRGRRRVTRAESVLRPRAVAHNIERCERRGRVDEDEPRGSDGKSRERHGRVNEDEPRPYGKSRDGRPSHIIIDIISDFFL
jgi:hypothetical protein